MMHGDLGQPPGGWPEAIQQKVLKGEKPITVRPGALMDAEDIEARRAEASEKLGDAVSDRDLASCLMYPKVWSDFAAAREIYGPVEVLPTPVCFYGLPPGEEILVDIEKGKTLVIRCQAVGETGEDGQVRVFFELNGQPRMVKVPDRLHGGAAAMRRRQAEDGNAAHVAAPMPGVVSTVVVKPGQEVAVGDVLVSMEAMKMETAIHADRDGRIAELTVKPGDQVDAKDLLVVYED